ncbi:MAG: hypothetical protein ABSH05_15790 [Bryobacteraceae bacterium]|jgi:hypothetical protein
MDQSIAPLPEDGRRQGLELGAWLGRGQAFGLIANKCGAAEAQCLKRIREEGAYKSLGCTWEDFCRQHLGLSRSRADQLIRQLDEFGAAYFHLAEIMQISGDSYRRIATAVHDDSLEIGGQSLPITPENAPRIREAVRELQKESERARAELAKLQSLHPSITSLKIRLDACFEEVSAMANSSGDPGEQAALRGLARYSLNKAKRLLRIL